MNRKTGIALVFLIVLMASAAVPIYASTDDFSINAHAKAVDADGDSVKNDIAVTGGIIIAAEGDTINIDLQIELEGPDGAQETQYLSLECEAAKNRNTLLTYEATFNDFATIKGMYYVTVTASSGDLTASADFKWDPPGGGGGPPEY
jgi:hypothetical protein